MAEFTRPGAAVLSRASTEKLTVPVAPNAPIPSGPAPSVVDGGGPDSTYDEQIDGGTA